MLAGGRAKQLYHLMYHVIFQIALEAKVKQEGKEWKHTSKYPDIHIIMAFCTYTE